jgi:drug/metabolite transporter (DMT)-like permease
MVPLAVALVVVAAALHASWNLLTKRSEDKLAFIWWGPASPAPSCSFRLSRGSRLWPQWPPHLWPRLALAAMLRAAYLFMLTTAYARGDLSIVYPLARGVGPIFVTVAAVVLLGERVTYQAVLGIVVVALGAYTMHLPRLDVRAIIAPVSSLASPTVAYAVPTGLLTAAYSLVDKWSMTTELPPAWYAYLTIPVAALLLTPLVVTRTRWRHEWRLNRRPIVIVALLMTGSYLLVLYALRIAPVSYVAPARELGIVFGTALGIVVLRERQGPQKLAGALLILTGVVLVVSSPPASR